MRSAEQWAFVHTRVGRRLPDRSLSPGSLTSSRRPGPIGEAWRAVSMQVRPRPVGWEERACDRGPGKQPAGRNEVMVIPDVSYSLSGCLAVWVRGQGPGQGCPGYPRSQFSPSGRPILLCALAAGAVKQPRCFGIRGGRLFATRRLWAPSSRIFLVSSTGLVRHQAHQRGLDYCQQKQLARCPHRARPRNQGGF